MAIVTNHRKTGTIICEGVHLSPGPNEITDEAAAKLQASKAYWRHAQRKPAWLAGLAKPDEAKAPTAAAVVAPPTNPAKTDGGPLDPGTKPEDAPLDFPEANDRSKGQSRAPAPTTKR